MAITRVDHQLWIAFFKEIGLYAEDDTAMNKIRKIAQKIFAQVKNMTPDDCPFFEECRESALENLEPPMHNEGYD
ncbi:hypothetical protein LCGC14_2564850 [marine sediment metagenome]|uniref:Uncharacterized protein n=2 Tax=marine sediment metagenome TaxID=412755 RepID=A0A0F9AJF8_9ZZZZ